MLTPKEVAARIKAARLLREMSQNQLAAKLVEAGLAQRLVGQLERGETPLRSAARSALAQALQFPERWFTASVDELLAENPPLAVVAELRRIRELLEQLARSNGSA